MIRQSTSIKRERGSCWDRTTKYFVLFVATSAMLTACHDDDAEPNSSSGSADLHQVITVSQNQILRDGVLWVPHAVQLVAFVAAPADQTGAFATAYANYSTAELSAIKAWGADSIRFQLSQPGADPTNSEHYDAAFVSTFVGAVQAARAIGLNVIVSIQDEKQSGETTPVMLPDAHTNSVWKNLAPLLNGDDGIMYELLNEPELENNAANWQQWAAAMNMVVQTIRATGATNALVADGLMYAEHLDGVIPLSDPLNNVIYSTHPYFHAPADQTLAVWMTKFGDTAATLPVIVGEWTTAFTYYCDANTATAALQFLQYIQSINVGLVAVTYDFGNMPDYGGIVSDFDGTPTTFANQIMCGQSGYGPGTLIQNWYKTGSVSTQLE